MEKVLTISIAAYNAEKDLQRCLDSLLDTKVANALDIIVVNDGSKDGTLKVAQAYQNNYPNIIRIIDKNNGGHGSTINASIKQAKGKYYKIVDSDDWVNKEGLENLVKFLGDQNVDLVLNPYYEIDAYNFTKKKIVYPSKEIDKCGEILNIDNIKDMIVYMHSITIKTDIVKQMGPIITENCFYVDLEYSIFPMLYVKNFVYLNFPVYEYLLGTQTQSMNMKNMIKNRNQHLKVIKRLTEFYNKNKKTLSENIKKLILRRIRYAVLNQYTIYLNMQPIEGKKEALKFDEWLKNTDNEIYKGPEGKRMQWIRLSRKIKFNDFFIGHKLFNELGEKTKKKLSSLK